MKRYSKLFICILIFCGLLLSAYLGRHYYRIKEQQRIEKKIKEQDRLEKEHFIKQITPEAQKMQKDYHIFASVILAQAILESQWGKSKLSSQYHNLFGIKGTGENSRLMETKEYVNGHWIVIKGRFRIYKSWDESIEDHTRLMLNGTDNNKKNYDKVVNAKNYKEAAINLQKAGYATDPGYAKKLISVIQAYNLDKYDK